MAYPIELRQKALEALQKGYSKKHVNEVFGLSINTLKSWEKLEKETGSLEKRPLDRKPSKVDRDELRNYYKDNPMDTHKEAAIHFNCVKSSIRYAKKVAGITRKKDNTIHRTKRTTKGRIYRNTKQLAQRFRNLLCR